MVTHQISYLLGCDRVLILEEGKIIHDQSPTNLKNELDRF